MWYLLQYIMFGITVLWSFPFILTKIGGFQLYKIKERQKINLLFNKINNSSIQTDDNKPDGFFFGYVENTRYSFKSRYRFRNLFDKITGLMTNWYIGYIYEKQSNQGDSSIEPYLLIKSSNYSLLFSNENNKNTIEVCVGTDILDLWVRSGTFYWFKYNKINFNVSKFNPKFNQELIINDIITKFKEKNNFVGYVYGPPGTGKSMIGILLAKELKGSIVKTFNPSQPGDCIENLYSMIEPSSEKPLIILFDEFDIMIDSIHQGITQHKNIPTQITNKTTWNMFFDDFNLGLYQNVIILLTSNVSPDDFKIKYDPSYIREGRINNSYSLNYMEK
jgi:hypothetical protein